MQLIGKTQVTCDTSFIPPTQHVEKALVLVTLDVQTLRSQSTGTAASIFPEGCLRIGLAPHGECILSFGNILLLSTPYLECALLQCSPEWEWQCPWLQHLYLVHCIEIHRGLFLALPAGQKHNARNSWWDSSTKCSHCVLCYHLCCHLWNNNKKKLLGLENIHKFLL